MKVERAAFMERRKWLLAAASELAAPALRVAAAGASRGPRTEPHAWRRGLIVGHNHIGDLLYRTPSLPHLRRALPDCEWHYVAAPHSAEVLDGNPHLAGVLRFARPNNRWRLGARDVRALRAARFDVALCTNVRGHYPDILLAAALGIPNRAGFTYKGLSGLVNHPAPIEYPSVMPAYFRAMVAHVGGVSPTWDLTPQVFTSPEDEGEAASAWDRHGLGARPVLACALTTRQTAERSWLAESYARTLRLVRREVDVDVVLCGAADDAAALGAVAAEAGGRCVVLAGALRLRALVAFLRGCAAMLSTDSGPRHLANAAGIPTLFIRNLLNLRAEQGSYCATDVDLTPADLECVPRERQAAALRGITPEHVARQLCERLARRGTGAAPAPSERATSARPPR